MREIKFRVWSVKSQRMLFMAAGDGRGTMNDLMQTEDWIVMQFTGLLDKEGVEIFEGDIVDGVLFKDFSKHKGRVLFDYNGYRIVSDGKSLQLDLTEKLEVIGNIHQHPNLLEQAP